MIYFFEIPSAGEVKIGWSRQRPEQRLALAEVWVHIRCLLVAEGDRTEERRIHKSLAALRTSREQPQCS